MSGGVENTPKLRFPEFSGEWSETELGALVDFMSGATPSKQNPDYWGSDVPWVSAKDLKTHKISSSQDMLSIFGAENTRLAETGDILVLVRGMTLMKDVPIGLVQRPLAFNQDIKALRAKTEIDSSFLSILLVSEKEELKKLVNTANHGTGRLDTESLKDFLTCYPTGKEQQKIAAFLGAVDAKIGQLTRKKALLEDYKKGSMQQLFTQKLRFKDDQGNDFPDWEEKKLRDVFDEVKQKVGNQVLPTFSISAGIGWVSQVEKFGRDISGQQNEKYTSLAEGEFSYNKGNSKAYKYGCVYPNDTGEKIAVPNVFISFRRKTHDTSIGFFAKLFENHFLDQGLRTLISSGARMDGLLNVNKDDFFTLKVPYPHPDEQQKIADFLSAIDAKISLVADELSGAQDFKKGLLQQMFV